MTETFAADELAMLSPEEREAIAEDVPAGDPVSPPEGTPREISSPSVFIPVYDGPSQEELDRRAAELNRRFDDGEMDFSEYLDARDAITYHRSALSTYQEAHQQLWQGEQRDFFRDHPEYRDNLVLRSAMETAFNRINSMPDAHTKSGKQLLDEARAEADRQIRELREAAHGGDRGGHIGANQGQSGTGDLSYLDRLEGAEFEAALSRLSPDDAERYLRG